MKLKNNRGITLIALVITIVVLLILAGISLNLVLGENGIIAKAKDAKSETERDKGATETALNSLYDEMVGHLDGESSGGNGGTGGTGEDSDGKTTYPIEGVGKFGTTGTIDGGTASASNPTIPAQYTPVNTRDAKWDAEGGPEYNKGLVIVDDNGNEWVWVPVANASVMYETSETEIELSGDTGVNTTKYSASEMISGITRGLPGSTNYREPDLLIATDGSGFSTDTDANAQTAGFENLLDMAENIVNDYNTMIRSIATYHGFYIGRYELTANGEKAGETLTKTNWYQLYANCKSLAVSEEVMTRMIWGCQWDVTCNWLANNGYNITNSRSWGNYSDSTGNAAVIKEDGTNAYGTLQDTGYSEYWKANNIYDFAGNCEEWTQEAYSNNLRAWRGVSNDAKQHSASARQNYVTNGPGRGDPANKWGVESLRLSLHFDSATLRTGA